MSRPTLRRTSVARLNIAVLLSGHGFGHATRTAAVLSEFAARRPVSLRVVSSAPSVIWPRALREYTTEWIAEPCDAGVVQPDDLSVDVAATQTAVESWDARAPSQLDRIVARLQPRVDLIVGDVPPLAFEAADKLRAPSVAIANFSWDWIYAEMGLAAAAETAQRAYQKAGLLLELTPAAPMPAFRTRVCVGTVGRDARAQRDSTRAALGIQPRERLILMAFRSPTLSRIALPQSRECLRFISSTAFPVARSDTQTIPSGIEFADALAASDVVVAKTGYGILADCAATGTPLLWASREGFPEDRVLEAWLQAQPWARRIDRSALLAGTWGDDLTAILSAPAPPGDGGRALGAACAAIAEIVS